MPKFVVTKCVDAYVHYEAEIMADNALDARSKSETLNGDLFWSRTGVTEYDHIDFDNIEPELVEEPIDEVVMHAVEGRKSHVD